jgi:hypothetical protein
MNRFEKAARKVSGINKALTAETQSQAAESRRELTIQLSAPTLRDLRVSAVSAFRFLAIKIHFTARAS